MDTKIMTSRAPRTLRHGMMALLLAACAAFAAPSALQAQDANDYIKDLTAPSQDEPTVTALVLRKMVEQAVAQNAPLELNRATIAAELDKLAQITVQIQFALDSAIIRPESYATIGAIADALHHPILWKYHFLITGNTDTTGNRARNLALSQQRADAVRDALVNLYGIDGRRLEAVGLGQEVLQTPKDPKNPINRRVQLFNIGLE
ncbi:OmpA family protein [Ancylobacter sp. 6x-1]|uniref:OmpA family protein n=1 Tax=Ancylobacter crimeensis TaxID=2579147 RepID=A0ABT0DF80_9HYPH|nr:OmpA family protein [Ancylobacter crimeensis]MCK0198608.1 OmpA family protein [Ancylobacter crimeensis]